jgi:hypothetical protein
MPGMKRKRSGKVPRYVKRPTKRQRKGKVRFAGKAGIARVVNKMLKQKIETKQSTTVFTDGQQVFHNNFVPLELASTFLRTTIGTGDPMNGTGNRIGDEITLKGISFKMMIELNERYSDVTFRLMCIRSAKGDEPTRDTLFKGMSGNKMLDQMNTERYSSVFQKTFKIVAPNPGTLGAQYIFETGGASGVYSQTASETVLSRATRIIKVWIPGTKFAKGGLIKYENGSISQMKFYDYTLVLYAYSNFTTLQDIFQVARVNDLVKTMYYTDA